MEAIAKENDLKEKERVSRLTLFLEKTLLTKTFGYFNLIQSDDYRTQNYLKSHLYKHSFWVNHIHICRNQNHVGFFF